MASLGGVDCLLGLILLLPVKCSKDVGGWPSLLGVMVFWSYRVHVPIAPGFRPERNTLAGG